MVIDYRYGVAGADRDPGSDEMALLGLSPDAYGYDWSNLHESNVVQMVALSHRNPGPSQFWFAVDPQPNPPYYPAVPFVNNGLMQQWVQGHPGKFYIIGNEPDKAEQDNLTPTQYAELFHKAAAAIRGWDSTAKVAPAAVSQDPGGWTPYLDAVITADNYILSCDLWTMHYYAHSPDTFKNKVTEFRQWRDGKPGQSGKELWLTEFGWWSDGQTYNWDNQGNFMVQVCPWLETSCQLHRWFWFEGYYDAQYESFCLLRPTNTVRTPLGEIYKNLAERRENTTMPNYFDSGWFAISNGGSWTPYPLTHDLGARPRKIQVFTASDNQGAYCCKAFSMFYHHDLNQTCGYWIELITATDLRFRPAYYVHYNG